MAELSVNLAGLWLQNPVIPASGTFGFGYEFAQWYDLDCLGAICTKGTTREPRLGNPLPRIAETPAGMLNAVGLQNPGLEEVLSRELPMLRDVFHQPILANISGFSLEEYIYCCEKADAAPQVDAIELNISCPNVHGGGLSFGADPVSAREVTAAVRRVTKKPLFVKLSPNVASIADVALACQDGGADGVSLINTLLGLRLDLNRRKPVLANVTGGLSGPAVLPVALRMVWQVYEAVSIPVIGMGGVSSARDVIEMMLCGATAVEVGAANLVNPTACRDIVADLPQAMADLGIDSLKDIIGGAH